MFSVLTEACHVGYSRELVGTVYCTSGQLNTTYATKYGIICEDSLNKRGHQESIGLSG